MAVQPANTQRVEFGSGLRSHLGCDGLAPDAFETQPEPSPRAWGNAQMVTVSPSAVPTWERRLPDDAAEPADSTDWVHELLRRRATEQAERIWDIFDDALQATDAHGRPDHRLRLHAARALLAEISERPPIKSPSVNTLQVDVPGDELGRHRRSRRSRQPR